MFNYEFDERKAAANLKKHGVSFEEAISVFDDYNALVFDDPDHSEEEERFIILGISAMGKTLFVAHCFREREDTIRIISARKASKREEKQYWSYQ